jgi:hypothetical protein
MIKLMVGIPAYGGRVVSQHAGMWFSLGQESAEREDISITSIMTVDANGIDRVRNRIVGEAMAAGNDWLLMIDADTWVNGNAGDSLLSMLQLGLQRATVVGAPVMRRGVEGLNAYRYIDGVHQPIAFDKFVSTERFVEVDAVGAAVIGINLHKIGDVEFEFTRERSEDIEFCYRLRRMNHHICIDTQIHTSHLGNPPVLEYR